MTDQWRGTLSIEDMRLEQIRCLEQVQGLVRTGDVWKSKDGTVIARPTDRPGLAIDGKGTFNCLVIEYSIVQGDAA